MGMGGMGNRGPDWGGSMAKLFGENKAFSADVEVATKGVSAEGTVMMPGRIAFDQGKSRFELDLLKSERMPAEAMSHMKAMGMDQMAMISRPDQKKAYLVYPGLKSYAEQPVNEANSKAAENFKIEITELGKETVDGHPCIKNKAVVTDDQGQKLESTVWNATDLKKFPVKIEQTTEGNTSIITFKNIKFAKPDAAQFEPPSNMKKYDSMQTLMQEEMMKRMGGMGGGAPRGNRQGLPPGHP